MTIADAWHSYESEVIPKDAHAVQIRECRRAFYAGAKAFMGIVETINGDMPDEQAELLLNLVDAELNEFKQRVLGGRA